MAKPMPASSASCSSGSQSHLEHPKHRHRRHKRRPTKHSGPSAALLSFLATIAASPITANGSPAPLPFLCPSLNIQDRPARQVRSRSSTLSSPTTEQYAGNLRHVPDKFEMDENGRWRRVDVYTLYGSTVCPNCQETTNSVTSVDDQIQSPSASSPAAAPSTTANYDIRDTLPPGWKPTAGTGGSRTTLILALSLVLAFFICFLIIGCLFWRKSKRRKRRQEDIEMKARRRRRSHLADDDTNRELIAEREVRVKQKIWARATARWKANARYTARQRRGKRIASTTRMTSSQNSSVSLDQVEDEQHTPHSIAPSLPLSRRSSLESLYANSSPPDAAIPPPESEIRTHRTTPSIASTTSSLSQLRVSPPAYHVRIIPRIHVTSDDSEDSSLPISSAASLHHTQRSLRSTYSQSNITDTTYDSDLISQPLHAAHVATDDKTLLAHLANLASHPPTDGLDSPQPDSASHQVSVPIWQDEQLEDFREQSCDSESILASNCPSRSASPAPIFPPPPSKGKMAAPAFYDYPYSFEDITLEPEPGPSAPPFEEEASCPPMGSIDFAPSAPPLLPLEVEWYMEYPSTPPHTMATNPDVEGIYYRNESHEEAQVPTTDQRSDSTVSSGSSDDILTSPVQGPVSSDGTPPSYHP